MRSQVIRFEFETVSDLGDGDGMFIDSDIKNECYDEDEQKEIEDCQPM